MEQLWTTKTPHRFDAKLSEWAGPEDRNKSSEDHHRDWDVSWEEQSPQQQLRQPACSLTNFEKDFENMKIKIFWTEQNSQYCVCWKLGAAHHLAKIICTLKCGSERQAAENWSMNSHRRWQFTDGSHLIWQRLTGSFRRNGRNCPNPGVHSLYRLIRAVSWITQLF